MQRRIETFTQKIYALGRRLWSITLVRFLVVGGVNTVCIYAVFSIFILLKLPYTLSTLFAYVFGVLFNFKTHGIVTFKNKSNRLIFRFVGTALLIYFLNIGLLKIFDLNNINSLIAQAIITLPLAVASFLLMKKFVFQTSDKKQNK